MTNEAAMFSTVNHCDKIACHSRREEGRAAGRDDNIIGECYSLVNDDKNKVNKHK
jgi:hypothetical protein